MPFMLPTNPEIPLLPKTVPVTDPLHCHSLSIMAATPESDENAAKDGGEDDDTSSFSYFQRTVLLRDWWLIKAEDDNQEKRLAVAGFGPREQQALRMFRSAPIVKRYDTFNLETADGIAVILQGFINKTRTLESGFSPQVFNHFLFGFPHYWEDYVKKPLQEEACSSIEAGNNSGLSQSTKDRVITSPKDCSPISTQNKPESTCVDGHNSKDIEDSSCTLHIDHSEEPDVQIDGANLNYPVLGKSNASIHSNFQYNYLEDPAKCSISRDKCHFSFSESPDPAITGSKDSCPISTQNKPDSTSLDKHIGIEDYSPSQHIDDLEEMNVHINVTNLDFPVQGKSNLDTCSYIQISYLEDTGKCSITPKKSHSPFSGSPVKEIFTHKKNIASTNNPSSLTCHKDSVNLKEDGIALQAEPAENFPLGSSEMINGCESGKQSKKELLGVLRTKASATASLESITINNEVSEECLVPRSPDVGNINVLPVDSSLSNRTSGVAVASFAAKQTISKHKNKKEKEEKDVVQSGTTNMSPASLSPCLEPVSRSNGDNVIDEDSEPNFPLGNSNVLECSTNRAVDDVSEECLVPRSPDVGNINILPVDSSLSNRTSGVAITLLAAKQNISKHKNIQEKEEKDVVQSGTTNMSPASLSPGLEPVSRSNGDNVIDEDSEPNIPLGNSNVLEHSTNHAVDAKMCYRFQSGGEANTTPSNSQSRTNDSCRVSKDKQKQRSIARCSVKKKALISDHVEHLAGEKLNGDSLTTVLPREKVNLPDAMLKAARSLKNASGKSDSKEKRGQTGAEAAGSSRKRARRKISFDAHDRNITGIQGGLDTVKLSRGSRSEPQRRRRK
ncbi:hypothetical protein Tsubulata_026351 [Turnera subulata]|uniref:SANTA domain-containing protein n=1 Tax=Turnera subulata TaxID=218843 RepID=A0A9Q0J9C8_9ROSI|nr:hypothetical protein Tsubulata_026351 [Turnera subulata]